MELFPRPVCWCEKFGMGHGPGETGSLEVAGCDTEGELRTSCRRQRRLSLAATLLSPCNAGGGSHLCLDSILSSASRGGQCDRPLSAGRSAPILLAFPHSPWLDTPVLFDCSGRFSGCVPTQVRCSAASGSRTAWKSMGLRCRYPTVYCKPPRGRACGFGGGGAVESGRGHIAAEQLGGRPVQDRRPLHGHCSGKLIHPSNEPF